jgi:endogenous inhibitor of DNA gyrase (YacG/DUF329 family)
MVRSEIRDRARKCPSCGQLVKLLRNNSFRRHFTTDPDGRCHLCEGSHAIAEAAPHAARRLDR